MVIRLQRVNVGNALLCVIYQLNFTVFIYVRRMCYIMLYIVYFGIIRSFMLARLVLGRVVRRYMGSARIVD